MGTIQETETETETARSRRAGPAWLRVFDAARPPSLMGGRIPSHSHPYYFPSLPMV